MGPRLLRGQDWWLALPLAAAALIVIAVAQDPTIPIGGLITAGLTVTALITMVLVILIQWWCWICRWTYQVMGVDYYYEDKSLVYPRSAVYQELSAIVAKWQIYNPTVTKQILNGITVTFRKDAVWSRRHPTFGTRLVTELARGTTVEVEHGGKPLNRTAHAHEVSHVILERLMDRPVSKVEAHTIFKRLP